MFWGLILKANKKYTQVLEKPFNLTKASLDYSTADDEPIQVMYSDGESTFLLCTLQKEKVLQCSLDLNFAEGNTICFSTKGTGIVHLTGYMIPDEDFGDMDMDDEEEESVDESEQEEAQPDLRELLQQKKKEKEKAGKKDKKKAPVVAEEESSDEESDEDILNGESTLDSSALLDDSDDDDEDGDEEDDSDDVEESDEEEEEIAPPKSKQLKLDPQQKKQNGVEKNGQDKKNKKDKKEKPAQPEKPEKKEQPKKENKPQADKIIKLQGGLSFQDMKPGTGAEAKAGKKVQVYYEGRLKSNNKMFDSTKSGAGFKFTLGRGEVIKAWDLGIVGMKVGGKRRVTCPPGLAYGAKGNPPVIPGNSTLVFDVELKNVL